MAPDEILLQKVLDGDSKALDELLERYYPKIMKYCLWHLSSREEAEDATQEVMIKVVRHLRRITRSFHFKSYIYQIAKNTCIDIYRKKHVDTVPLDPLTHEAVLAETVYRFKDDELISLIHTLPDDLREVILLRYGQQMSLQEIAEATGVSMRTAQSRLRRAVNKIRKEYKNDA